MRPATPASLAWAALLTLLLSCAAIVMPRPAGAYPGPDAQCPNGWDLQTNTCLGGGGYDPGYDRRSGQNDAACQATAEFRYCQASVYIGCTVHRSPYACRLLQLSQSNPGQFQQIMNAQKACYLDRVQQACAFLERFRGTYF